MKYLFDTARRAKSLRSREAKLAGAAGHMKGRAWSRLLGALLDLLRADLFSEPQTPSTGLKGALPRGGQLKPQAHSPPSPAAYLADDKLAVSGHPSHFAQHTASRWAVRHTGSWPEASRENALE